MISIIYIYMLVVAIIATYYVKTKDTNLRDLVAIISGVSLSSILLQYIFVQKQADLDNNRKATLDYIDRVNGIFLEINNLLSGPHFSELQNLIYEFYGFTNYPFRKETKKTPLTGIEYITCIRIINLFSSLYKIKPDFYEELDVRNRVMGITQSNKFKTVWSYVKNNYNRDFVSTMEKYKLIDILDPVEIVVPVIQPYYN